MSYPSAWCVLLLFSSQGKQICCIHVGKKEGIEAGLNISASKELGLAMGYLSISCFVSMRGFSSLPTPISGTEPSPMVQGPCSSPGVRADRNEHRQGVVRQAHIVMHDWPAAINGN